MPIDKDSPAEIVALAATVAVEPKMTMDEVGADIDEHGYIPVTHETATLDPFSAKWSLANALDAVAMDGAEEIEAKPPVGKDPEPDYSKYSEEDGSHIPLKAPEIPSSMGGDEDKPDANGLVYVSATFTVDPDKYVSNNYRPGNMGKMPDAAALLKQKSGAMKYKAANPEDEAAISDLGTLEAMESAASPDEPTEQQEKEAAKEADKEQKKEPEADAEEERKQAIPTAKGDRPAADSAPESVVLDYATFIDGSSFICYDEVADIDYSKIAMDAGPKKAPTRGTCQTTFAQCRAKNPLFCRFHGPKLLEADIKTAIKATVGPGCVVQVTKDKNSKNKFTFRLTVGCPPAKKKMVEKMVHMFLTQNPGISSSTEDWNLVGKHKQTTEFEMDILQADKPPKKDTIASQALADTKMAKKMHKEQAVVGETAPALEKKAAKGEKWETVDEAVEKEWADLVDKNVHKSLLGNNGEFLHNFNEIANQFDEAHDKGDAEGLKKALESLKAEIGKYDENGEKKPGAAATEPEEPEAQQTKAEGQPEVSNKKKVGGNAAPAKKSSEGKAIGEEAVVLPTPNDASSGKVAESSQPPKKDTVKQTPNSKANELASKISNFKAQLDGMIESGADAENIIPIKELLSGVQTAYDKLAAQYEDIAVLDAKFADVAETNDIFGKKLIEDAKRMAEGNANQLLAELESKVGGIEAALAEAGEKVQDFKKGKIADEVEKTIKGLAAYVFGGKRPPQGVDSVTDYLDYKKEEMETSGEGSSLSPDEMANIEDTYHLKESYDATKAASNAMDAAVAEFKELMDGELGKGEGDESYMDEVEKAQKKVKETSSELMVNFDAYKKALEKCQYEVDAAKKLEEAKKKLAGVGMNATQGRAGERPVKPLDSGEGKNGQPEKTAPQGKLHLSDEEKKAKIAAMSPKQKLEAAVKIFKKKLAANPNDAEAKTKLAKYEAMLSKLSK